MTVFPGGGPSGQPPFNINNIVYMIMACFQYMGKFKYADVESQEITMVNFMNFLKIHRKFSDFNIKWVMNVQKFPIKA